MSENQAATAVTLESLQKENIETKALLSEAVTLLKEVKDRKPEAPNIRKGENTMTSRPYSYGRLIRAMRKKSQMDSDWSNCATVELGLASKLKKETDEICGKSGSGMSEFCAPMATGFLPVNWDDVDEAGAKRPGGERLPGYSQELVKEVGDHFRTGFEIDMDEAAHYGFKAQAIQKAENMVRNNFIYGGALVPAAERGELIEVLRNTMSLTALPGTRSVPLPPQGTVIYPRQTSVGTVDAYVEGESTAAMDIQFGEISLNAKKYSGLVNVTEDLLRAASGSYSVESMLRMEIAEELGRKPDRDMIYGTGGKYIRGLTNIPNILDYECSDPNTDGDVLYPEDLKTIFAQMAGRNAPVNKGVALLMRPELWDEITNVRDAQGSWLFSFGFNNGGAPTSIFTKPVYLSTNMTSARRKGAGTALAHVLAVIPSEIMIGQSGVMDFSMTDSDGTNFQSGLKTIRAVTYMDMNVRHEVSIGHIDKIASVRTDA